MAGNNSLDPNGKKLALFVVEQILHGIDVQLEIEGKAYNGKITKIETGYGESDYFFAEVQIKHDGGEDFCVRVSVDRNGEIRNMSDNIGGK